MKKLSLTLPLTLLCLCLAGCETVPPQTPVVPAGSGNVYRLEQRPDALAAVKAAPAWAEDSLLTINTLETEIKELKAERQAERSQPK